MGERGRLWVMVTDSSPAPHLCCPLWPEYELPLCPSRDAIYQQR